MIPVDVDDPDGVTAVQIYFQLQNKKTGEYLDWNNLPMVYEVGRLLPHWTVDITANNIAGNLGFDEYWFQFYFVATDKTGAQTQSDLYGTLVIYLVCAYIT